MSVNYQDFSLRFEPYGSPHQIRVLASTPAGEGGSLLDFQGLSAGDLLQSYHELVRAGHFTGSAPSSTAEKFQKPRDFGHHLFRALFSGPIRQLYERSRGATLDPRQGLRIQLRFSSRNAAGVLLHALPWELLYCEETRDYLGLSRLTPLVRYLEVARPQELGPPARRPLRILLAAASPAGTVPLDLQRERQCLDRIAAENDGKMEIHSLATVDLDHLRQALSRGSFDVLHFMGHGNFDTRSGGGSLLLESAEGLPDEVTGEALGNLLKDCPPRLTVINACVSARSGSEDQDFFAGVAPALVLAGLPAAIAMREAISDEAAIAFSTGLYQALAAGDPIDAAVAEGRLAVYRKGRSSFEWASPVLFMRTTEGVLLPAQGEPETTLPSKETDHDYIRARVKDVDSSARAEIINEDGVLSGRKGHIDAELGNVKGTLIITNHRK